MPFIPDSHNFVVTIHREENARRFENRTIELFYRKDPDGDGLRVKRVRRTNTPELVDERYWILGKPQSFAESVEGLLVVPLTFQGEEFSCELEERAKSCQKTASLLQLFSVGGRLHVEVAVNEQRYTNLFLNLNYHLPAQRLHDSGPKRE